MSKKFDNGLSKEFDYFIALKIAINQRLNINTAEIDAPYFTESNKDKAESANYAAKQLIPIYEKIIKDYKDEFTEKELSDLLNN